MKSIFFFFALALSALLNHNVSAQTSRVYQPTDHWNRGLIYRMQTGHAGAFADRDNDLAKIFSPYIEWNCRPNRRNRPILDFLGDHNRKIQRLIDGTGAVAAGDDD